MSFRLLGPLEIVTATGPLPLRGMNQRAILTFLLLHTNQVVATSDLMQVLWPNGDAPTTARKVLQNTISALRGVLTRGAIPTHLASLVSQAPGYMLRMAPEILDLARFRILADQGRTALAAGQPESAARFLRAALGLWRGRAGQELAESGIDWTQLAVADNARTAALEDYCDAELRNGRYQEVIGRLEAATAAEPSRERSSHLLMLALYRAGHQAGALRAYERLRQQLSQDFGVQPSRELRNLHQSIIDQDPALLPSEEPDSPEIDFSSQSDPELDLLFALLSLVQRQQRPHVVTLAGGTGGGTGWLLSELTSRLRQDGQVTVWHVRTGPDGAALGDDLRAALRRATPHRPLVVVAENLHHVGGAVPACVGEVIRTAGRTPLLVVLTSRAEPESLWPGWNAAVPWSTTVMV
ncbi:BTAD domain-containing putative transcriptional regulator [Streptomyces sp. H27-C3]|uniref:AfsR/SARP family transcriptional regulator n=1 Tax=Streptomyces sp. H27-C3 TaxID=3046305 RepID=UPI0024BA725F|nr:BTAD domain-containing putative transcriptional regulator [Streptomyces sp. H27-C3]MDJ0460423.1 BTAD domain-containing putative transcriptional regulator [Streptomyces sp. H27-C3]